MDCPDLENPGHVNFQVKDWIGLSKYILIWHTFIVQFGIISFIFSKEKYVECRLVS